MTQARSPWRAVRPVLLAGAVALAWLTFSSPAATADCSHDTPSALGGLTSSVSAPTRVVAGLPLPGNRSPRSSVPGQETSLGPISKDNLAAALPAVTHQVPPATVPAISTPVASVEDHAAAGISTGVVTPLSDALSTRQPALTPIPDLTTLKPVTDPATETIPPPFTGSRDVAGGSSRLLSWHAHGLEPALGKPKFQVTALAPPLGGLVLSGSAGSKARSVGVSGPVARLDELVFHFPVSGLSRALGYSGHAPAPVSFDRGASPD